MTGFFENKPVSLVINGIERLVAGYDGEVKYVLGESEPIKYLGMTVGHQKVLKVTMENGHGEKRFMFHGDSPIKRGDHLTAGIILKEGRYMHDSDAAYIALYDAYGSGSHHLYERIDYMNGFNPTAEEKKRIVFD